MDTLHQRLLPIDDSELKKRLSRIIELSYELKGLLDSIPVNNAMTAGFHYQRSYLIPQLNALTLDAYNYLQRVLTKSEKGVSLPPGVATSPPQKDNKVWTVKDIQQTPYKLDDHGHIVPATSAKLIKGG